MKEREFYCYVCGCHPSALIMDLDGKIAFKMPTEEFAEIIIDRIYNISNILNTEHRKVKTGTEKNI